MLTRFYVKNLFGIFDNEINFRDGGITIIVGRNGCGKTTMLNMLSTIFSQNHSNLLHYEFEYIEVEILGHILRIEPMDVCFNDEDETVKSLRYYLDSVALDKCFREDSKINSPSFWMRHIPSLRRRTSNLFVDMRTGQTLSLSEVIDTFFDTLPNEIKDEIVAIPNEVHELIKNLNIVLISTDRLKKLPIEDEYRRLDRVEKYAVEECSEELKNSLKNSLSEYANISQKLDEQFPSKILKSIKDVKPITIAELEGNIQEIDSLRKKHIDAGVLEANSDKVLSMDLNHDNLDDTTSVILTMYYQDMKTKLESLDIISDKIVLFKNMLKSKFGDQKELLVNKEEGIYILQTHKKDKIELKYLSSGEQQELVLLYNLIFKGEKESLILIDEPEISLNVSWQREYLDDMKKIVAMNQFSTLIATHSPQIINDNWELVESLGELN